MVSQMSAETLPNTAVLHTLPRVLLLVRTEFIRSSNPTQVGLWMIQSHYILYIKVHTFSHFKVCVQLQLEGILSMFYTRGYSINVCLFQGLTAGSF